MGDNAVSFTEAPASWNVRYRTPDGFDAMLTLRGDSGADLLPKTEAAVKWLQGHGASPNGRSNGRKPASNANAPLCPTHGTPMRQSQHGNGWYCPTKVADVNEESTSVTFRRPHLMTGLADDHSTNATFLF